MRFLIDRTSIVHEGTHDEIIVQLSVELSDGLVHPSGFVTVSDREATSLARLHGLRRLGETLEEYEQRVVALLTWSEPHVAQLVAQKLSVEAVEFRPPVPLVKATE